MQEFGYMQIRRLEYANHIEALAPQQQTVALAGAVLDMCEQVTATDEVINKRIKAVEKVDKRMDTVETMLGDVMNGVENMTTELKRVSSRFIKK